MLLIHSKVDFEDIRFEYSDWDRIKEENPGKFEFNEVPILENPATGEVFSQSISIFRMLGKQHGYYPEDSVQAWKVDSAIDAGADLQEKFWDVMMAEHKKESAER